MQNSLKEEYFKLFAKRLFERKLILEDSVYGKFIIQTSEVQFYLKWLILLRSYKPNKKLEQCLEKLEIGKLINYFRICAKDNTELALVKYLKEYNARRIKLAHKMFPDKRLTVKNCKSSIKLGEKLLAEFRIILNLNEYNNK